MCFALPARRRSPHVRAHRPQVPRPAPLPERRYLADALRTETVGGVLLLLAAVTALIWANSP